MKMNERELNTTKSSCPWWSIQDRNRKDAQNVGFWTSEQIGKMNNLHRIFNETYGEKHVRKNINKKFFAFKILETHRLNKSYFAVLEEHLENYSVEICNTPQGKIFRINPRNVK